MMKLLPYFLLIFSLWVKASESLWERPLPLIGKSEKTLSQYLEKGPVLLVNIATQCGYTGQLDDLENLYQQYKGKGLTLIGIPSNDFGGQTPESNNEVKKFCKLNYGVTFPLMKKQVVKGEGKYALVQWLLDNDRDHQGEIAWNFEKFLLIKESDDIKLAARFRSSTKPSSKKLMNIIEKYVTSK